MHMGACMRNSSMRTGASLDRAAGIVPGTHWPTQIGVEGWPSTEGPDGGRWLDPGFLGHAFWTSSCCQHVRICVLLLWQAHENGSNP
jgi:hypothetical protein